MLATETPEWAPNGTSQTPMCLDALLRVYHKWLYLPDEEPLFALLGCVVANRGDGDPVWLLVIAPPGAGKTEMIQPLTTLPDVRSAGTMTEASLLSGSQRGTWRSRQRGACSGRSGITASCS